MFPQERERELLDSLKQSEVANVVTKGLNPNVKMKDSGIPWIGEIPEHWEVRRFSNMINVGKGLPITKADLISEGIPVVSYGQIHSKQNVSISLKDELIRFVSPKFLASNPQCLLQKGDLAFADTSEDFEGSGNFVFNDRAGSIFAGYHTLIIRLKDKDVLPKYIACLASSQGFRNQIRSKVNGVKVFSITRGIIKNAYVVLPPLSEQQAIVAYIDSKLQKIDQYMCDLQREIDYLKEFKQRLISDAVTGQLCVTKQ